MCAPSPPESSGEAPSRAPGSASPVPNTARPVTPASVGPSLGGTLGCCIFSERKGQRARKGRARALKIPDPNSPPGAADVPQRLGRRRGPRPRPDLRPRGGAALTAGSCWSCAGCSVRAACAKTAWLELRARQDRRAEPDAGRAYLRRSPESTLRNAVRASQALLRTAQGAGLRPSPPSSPCCSTWLICTSAPFPRARAQNGGSSQGSRGWGSRDP